MKKIGMNNDAASIIDSTHKLAGVQHALETLTSHSKVVLPLL